MNKNRFKRIALALFLIFCLSSVVIAYATDSTVHSDNDDDFVSGIIPVYTPASGGILYVLNAGIANIVNGMEDMEGARLATEATSGSNEIMALSLDKADENKPFLASNAQPSVYRVYEGTDENLEKPHSDLRAVAKLEYAAVHLIVPENSPIESYKDLKGKTIGVGPGTAQELYIKDLLNTGYGLKEGEDYQLVPIGYQEVQQGIQDNSVDSGILMGALPAPLVVETARTSDVRILSVEQDAKEKMQNKHPYYEFKEVESSTYNNQDEDLTIGSIDLITFTHKDTPDVLIEKYLDGILGHRETFEEIHGSAQGINSDSITEGLLMPLHSGAEKYYEATGIEVVK